MFYYSYTKFITLFITPCRRIALINDQILEGITNDTTTNKIPSCKFEEQIPGKWTCAAN